ncbi:MAG: glutathione S-transferase N-terminal domain-containing protein [Planctomycetes bacterium]|jgi:glutaredoxin|nr:glutathione S-transferase N-terminal domain-containing protein [Planctomycetota bacterium]
MTKVTVYSTITCQYCILAKRYLEQKGIDFEEVDITFDPAKTAELAERTGQNRTPVFIINKDGQEQAVAGFDKSKLDELLGLKPA